jgi:hypothetical protein
MDVRGVRKKIIKSDMPNCCQCVKSKWDFNFKWNGVFWCQLVACGYNQVPGIDYNDNFSPVVNDVTFRILFAAMLAWNHQGQEYWYWNWVLHGDLKEEIMEIPEGMDAAKEECFSLTKQFMV